MALTSETRHSSLDEEKSRIGSNEGSNGLIEESSNGEKAAPRPNEDTTVAPFSPTHEIAFIFVICMAQFLALAGLLQSIAPLEIIGRSFGVTDEATLSWYPAAFSLTVGTFILPAGRLGDMYGHKNLYIAGFAWYAISSVIAGVAIYSGDILFSVARALQGIGCALLVPNALAIVGRTYGDSPKKNMIFALFGAAAPTGAIAGAAMSAVLAQLAWWPWAFFAMAIACVFMIVAALVVIPKDDVHPTSLSEFDFLGCATGVGGLVLFNFAWNQAAVVGWNTIYTYVLLIVGILLLAAFAVVEIKVAKNPLVPLRGFKGEAALALGVIAAGWGSFGIWVFYLWRLIENLRGYSPLAATAQTSPVAPSGLLAAVTTGILLSHIKPSYVLLIATLFFLRGYSPLAATAQTSPVAPSGLLAAVTTGILLSHIKPSYVLLIATLFFLTGQILLATVPVDQIYWGQTFVTIVIMPWGMDLSFPSGTIILSNSTPKHDQGIAASLVNTVVNYSISLGLGIAGTIVRNVGMSGGTTLESYRGAWYLGIGLDALAVAIALYFVIKSR